HTAVWSGQSMIVWGGASYSGSTGQTGGRYDPASNQWTSTSVTGAPSARIFHSAVWTGNRMVIWGGAASGSTNTGARYDPANDIWEPTTTLGAPEPRSMHQAVWTGTLMLVWGGARSVAGTSPTLVTGGRYDPVADSWTPMPVGTAPSA